MSLPSQSGDIIMTKTEIRTLIQRLPPEYAEAVNLLSEVLDHHIAIAIRGPGAPLLGRELLPIYRLRLRRQVSAGKVMPGFQSMVNALGVDEQCRWRMVGIETTTGKGGVLLLTEFGEAKACFAFA